MPNQNDSNTKAGSSPDSKPDSKPNPKPEPTVIGIGASAGGLAALRTFFAHVPEESGLAFVVVVHLSPEHKSHLADLLQPHVKMPVQQVTETIPLEPNHVYVIPPNANLNTIDTHLRLSKLEEKRRNRAPIDHFFRTLSRTHDGHAIGVILTGTGSDGALGIKEIKEQGGLTIVQDPNEAEYDGMPQSAIATGLVDLVLPLAEIPERALRAAHTKPKVRVPQNEEEIEANERQLLQKVFAQIRARTGRDFGHYKRSTILRRIARRMQIRHVEELADYLDLLRSEASEVRALADDLLITVTSFFRDRDVFERLEQKVIPQMFEGREPNDTVRVWSVGCATGEEAYSLAILLLEEAARHDAPPLIQIFASDLHEHSLAHARDGFYPGDIETEINAERLRRFFIKEDGGYRIRKEVRELVVFAPHNLLGDPPFSRLDLVACRNVLIYLQRAVQQDVIELFHYALRPGGVLALGTAETIESSDLFHTEDKKLCLFRKRNVPAPEPRLPVFPLTHVRLPGDPPRSERGGEPVAYGTLHQRLVERYAPPSLLVTPDDKIAHLSEHAGRYLVHPGGELTANVYKLVREELRIELRAALHAAREADMVVRAKPIPVRFDGEASPVVLHVRPSLEPEQAGYALVIFEEGEAVAPFSPFSGAPFSGAAQREPVDRPSTNGSADESASESGEPERVRVLETELNLAQQRLQRIIEEYETSQEEMKAANEEMQSTNEELRSTMEELETSKEELQSMNEELQTVNQENRHKVEELAQLSGDLQNLLSATDIATLFLDRDLRIMRFTPKVGEIFNVRLADRGRPLSDLTHRLGYDDLQGDARRVLKTLIPVEREVRDDAGRWYLARVLPYRSGDDRIEGVVITFVDITQRVQSEAARRESEERYRLLVENAEEYAIFTMDKAGRIVTWNSGAEKTLGWTAEEAIGQSGVIVFTAADDGDRFEYELETAAAQGQAVDERWHVRRDGRRFWANGMMFALRDSAGTLHGFAKLLRDETGRMQAEEALRETRDRLLMAQAASGLGWATVNFPTGEIVCDARAREILGLKGERTLDTFLEHRLHPEDRARVEAELRASVAEQRPLDLIFRTVDADGELRHVHTTGLIETAPDGSLLHGNGFVRDVTEQERAKAALQESEERYRLTVENVDEYAIFTMDEAGHIASWNLGAEQVLGWSEAEVVGQSGDIIFTTEDRAQNRFETEMRRSVEKGNSSDERWHLRKDGSRFWAYGFMTTMSGDDGEPRGFVKLLRDETERREREEALRESEARLRQALDAANMGIWLYDIEAGVTHFDARARTIFGLGKRTLEQGEVSTLIFPDDLPEFQSARDQALDPKQGDTFRETHRIVWPDGSVRWIEGHAQVLFAEEKTEAGQTRRPVQAVGVVVDVTERMADAQALRELNETLEERVDERTRQVRELATELVLAEQNERHRIAQMLHDELQQQLYAVQMHLKLLGDNVVASEPTWAGQAQSLIGYLGDAITITRRLTVDLSPPVLQGEGLLAALRWLVSHMEEVYDLQVELVAEKVTVAVDDELRILLFRLVRELLFNVVKHAGVNQACVDVKTLDHHVEITVIDEGQGFDLQTLSVERPAGGWGLYSVRERLNLFGGSLNVESAPGAGTRVTIVAPLQRP